MSGQNYECESSGQNQIKENIMEECEEEKNTRGKKRERPRLNISPENERFVVFDFQRCERAGTK